MIFVVQPGKLDGQETPVGNAIKANCVPAYHCPFIDWTNSHWVPAWYWTLFWALGYSSEQTKSNPLPRTLYILMCGLENSDTCEILLDTDEEIRFMSLELREETRAQGSEKDDISVGWECFREQQAPAWGLKDGQNLEGTRGTGEIVEGKADTQWLSWDQGSEGGRGGFMEDRGVGQAVETWKVRENLTNLHRLSTGVDPEWRRGQCGTKQHKVSGATLASPAYMPQPFPRYPLPLPHYFLLIHFVFLVCFFILICLLSLPICLLHPFLWWLLFCPLHVILIPLCLIMNVKNQESKKLFWPMTTGSKEFLEHQSLTENWLRVNSLRPVKFSQALELASVCHLIISYNNQK